MIHKPHTQRLIVLRTQLHTNQTNFEQIMENHKHYLQVYLLFTI